jgi:cysteine-rich repeat protein
MVRRYRLLTLALAGCAWSAACNTFNDDLEARIPDGGAAAAGGSSGADGSGGTDGSSGTDGTGGADGTGGSNGTSGTGGTGSADADAPISVVAEDVCENAKDLPLVVGAVSIPFTTAGVTNTYSDLQSNCPNSVIGRRLDQSDAFFKVRMQVGKRYHFHVSASTAADQDLAVYLLSGCDERTCVGGIDECPARGDEHFSVEVAQTADYFVGIDGITAEGAGLGLRMLSELAECGDRSKAHSEACDDGNKLNNDGCDEFCRKEINNGENEQEPNGDRFGANFLRYPASRGDFVVKGELGGVCNLDHFAILVPAGFNLKVRFVNEAGDTCAGIQPTDLRVLDRSFVTRAQAVDTSCPAIDTTNLAAGEYYIRARTVSSGTPFRYLLHVELVAATP